MEKEEMKEGARGERERERARESEREREREHGENDKQQRHKQQGCSCVQFPAACCFYHELLSDAAGAGVEAWP